MDVRDRTILILGGAGLVGGPAARRLAVWVLRYEDEGERIKR